MIRHRLTEAERDRVAEVFTTHQRFLEHVARQHAPHPDQVADIVQAVALKVCRGLNGFRGESELQTWLYRVTVNESRNSYRREFRQHRIQDAVVLAPEPDAVVHPDDVLIDRERVTALQAGIGRLKATYRDAMRNQLDGSPVEPSSKSSRHRARQQLKTLLADDPRLGG